MSRLKKLKRRRRKPSFSLYNLLNFVVKELFATETIVDITWLMLIATLCSLAIAYPQDYRDLFKSVLTFACGWYFNGKLGRKI